MQNFTRILILLVLMVLGGGNAFAQCELVAEGDF